jgi:hypothetical protein
MVFIRFSDEAVKRVANDTCQNRVAPTSANPWRLTEINGFSAFVTLPHDGRRSAQRHNDDGRVSVDIANAFKSFCLY